MLIAQLFYKQSLLSHSCDSVNYVTSIDGVKRYVIANYKYNAIRFV